MLDRIALWAFQLALNLAVTRMILGAGGRMIWASSAAWIHAGVFMRAWISVALGSEQSFKVTPKVSQNVGGLRSLRYFSIPLFFAMVLAAALAYRCTIQLGLVSNSEALPGLLFLVLAGFSAFEFAMVGRILWKAASTRQLREGYRQGLNETAVLDGVSVILRDISDRGGVSLEVPPNFLGKFEEGMEVRLKILASHGSAINGKLLIRRVDKTLGRVGGFITWDSTPNRSQFIALALRAWRDAEHAHRG